MTSDFKKLHCSKTKFVNESFALQYIDKLKKTSTRTKVPRRAYLCEHCLTWHLTSSMKNEDTVLEKYRNEIDRLGKLILEINARFQEKNEEKKKTIRVLSQVIKERNKAIQRLKQKLQNLEK